jgi:hypothetical protein
MTFEVSREWRLLRAISTRNISLDSRSVAAETGSTRDRRGSGDTQTIETSRWEDGGKHEA